MNKSELTSRLAHAANTSNSEAADYLDYTVLSILKGWKHAQTTTWPGLGVFARDIAKSSARKPAKLEAR